MQENILSVHSEIGELKRLLVHSPDKGLGKVIPSKAQDWLFEDIVHLKSIRENEYDYYTKLLLYFLDPEKMKPGMQFIDDPKNDRAFYKPGHPNFHASDKVLEIEYCNYSCKDFLIDISKLSEIEMEKYLDIFFFQIIYTIVSIQKIYPYFTHNDLFIRNILGLREKDNGNYYTYTFNDKNYYINQKLFYPKINDFGKTNLNEKYKKVKLYKSQYKDIYNLLLAYL